MKNSYEIVWKYYEDEYFSFLGEVWSVSKAKQILIKKPREIVHIDPKLFEPLIGGFTSFGTIRMGVGIDRNKLSSNKIDLSIPVIIVEKDNGKHMLIDGWHRLAKALNNKLKQLPAVVLDLIENRQILIR